MPYRRLPNTDSSRLRSLKMAISRAENLPPREKPYSQSSLNNITHILPQFERLVAYQKEAYEKQTEKSLQYNYLYKKARNYVSHFIQVLNLAIVRGDLKKEARDFFGLDKDANKLPVIKTEKMLIQWGKIVLEGEPERIANGGNPMTNPTIGVVKVHFEKFLEAYYFQKNLQDNYARASKKVAEFRPKVDAIIVQLWNEIEASFEPNTEVIRRNLCREYGLVYFFRRNELIPDNENVSEEYRKNRVVNKSLIEVSSETIEEKKEEVQLENKLEEEVVDKTEIEEVFTDKESVSPFVERIETSLVSDSEQEEEAEKTDLVYEESVSNLQEEETEEELASFQYSLF